MKTEFHLVISVCFGLEYPQHVDGFCGIKDYSIDLFIRCSRDHNKSCVADEHLHLFSTQIHIR